MGKGSPEEEPTRKKSWRLSDIKRNYAKEESHEIPKGAKKDLSSWGGKKDERRKYLSGGRVCEGCDNLQENRGLGGERREKFGEKAFEGEFGSTRKASKDVCGGRKR